MKALSRFSSHKYDVTTSKKHRYRLILSRLPTKKENGFAAQAKRQDKSVSTRVFLVLTRKAKIEQQRLVMVPHAYNRLTPICLHVIKVST